jgi:hypothetical protein
MAPKPKKTSSKTKSSTKEKKPKKEKSPKKASTKADAKPPAATGTTSSADFEAGVIFNK